MMRDMTARQVRIFELILVLSVAFLPALIKSITFLITGDIGEQRQMGNIDYVVWVSQAILSIALLFYILLRNNKNFGHIGLNLKFTRQDLLLGLVLMALAWLFSGVLSGSFNSFSPALSDRAAKPQNMDFLKIHSVGLIFIISIVFPLQEELIVRGFTMTEIFGLTENKKLAVTISVLIQFSYHLYQGLPAALLILPYFILVAIYFVRTGNLNAIIISHFLFDFIGLMMRR